MVKSQNYKYAFIILHYNALEVTVECIDSILKLDRGEECGIVIVDNASPNLTGQMLKDKYKEFENIHVILRKENDGFSRGNNAGCEYAVENWQPEFLIVSNNDIVFENRDLLQKIEKEYEKTGFAVLGGDVFNPETGIHQNPLDKNIRDKKEVRTTILLNQTALIGFDLWYPLLKSKMEQQVLQQDNQYQQYQQGVVLTGACLIFSKELFGEKKPVFSPETEFYYEEYILFSWCRKHQKKVIYTPEIRMLHKEGSSTRASFQDKKERTRVSMKRILKAAKIFYSYLEEQKSDCSSEGK